MKKTIYLIMLVFLSYIFTSNVVYAQSENVSTVQSDNILPQQTPSNLPENPRALDYYDYYFVQENESTYEYIVIYYLPYSTSKTYSRADYVFVYKFWHSFYHGAYYNYASSYVLEEQVMNEDSTEFHFRFTINKNLVDNTYNGNVTKLFLEDSAMYVEIEEDYEYQYAYHRGFKIGFNAGVKSVTDKYSSYVFKWTLPFVTLVIISAIYYGFKKEWFKK